MSSFHVTATESFANKTKYEVCLKKRMGKNKEMTATLGTGQKTTVYTALD